MIAAGALALRCVQLDDRPIHTDEAAHGVVLGEMLETGVYRYNPHDMHGPLLYYLSWPVLRGLGVRDLAGMEAWHLRLVSALIGTATVLALGAWIGELGGAAVSVSGALVALAAPFVYYHRYLIHEGLFVLVSLVLLRCVVSIVQGRSAPALALATGAVSALLFATKETAPLTVLALVAAVVALRFFPASAAFKGRSLDARFLLLAAAALIFIFALLFSSFGANPHGLVDAVAAHFRFLHRAGGEGHAKPWWTYLAWLFAPNFYTVPWSGWIIGALALAGAALRMDATPVRLIAFFTLALGLIYTLIPYKTPWLELNFLAPACLLAGVGAAEIASHAGRMRLVLPTLGTVAMLALARETGTTSFIHPADPRNPFAYSPTSPDIDNLAAAVTRLKAQYPADEANVIDVISTDYWPLPWYLRRAGPVGYWSDVPATINGDIIITSPDLLPDLQAKLGPGWTIQYFGLRADVLAIVLAKPTAHD